MSTAAIIYIVLSAIGLGADIQRHGEPKTGTHSMWGSIFSTALVFVLLYWGGFFDKVPS